MRAFTRDVVETGEPVVRLSGARFDFGADAQAASPELGMMPGRFAVEMCPPPHEERTASGLYTVARDEWTDRPDAGLIVGVPRGFPFRLGQAVIVDHEPGQRIDGAVFGDYHATEEVRLYGNVVLNDGMAAPWPWPKCILMSENPSGTLVVGKRRFVPEREWVLVARDGLMEKSEGGIFLPDSAQHGCCKATVVQAGGRAFGPDLDDDGKPILLQPGERIQYVANPAKGKREVRGIFADIEGIERLALVHVGAILCTLPGEAAPDDYLDRMVAVADTLAV